MGHGGGSLRPLPCAVGLSRAAGGCPPTGGGPGLTEARWRPHVDWRSSADAFHDGRSEVRLWATLYASIWIVFFEFLLGLWPDPPWVVPYLHIALGVAFVGVAYYAARRLRATRVPGRVKRTANAAFGMTLVLLVTGLPLWAGLGSGGSIPVVNLSFYRLVLLVHVVLALAVITQAAAVAIAYDMWEDREFEKETAPGEVPPMRVPQSP